MRALKGILTSILLVAVLGIGSPAGVTAFGQKNDNRPPKEPQKVKEREKPPPNSNNQSNNNKKKP